MELSYDANDTFYEVIFYVQSLKDDTTLCTVCLCDETEDGQLWTRYKLRCGHISHLVRKKKNLRVYRMICEIFLFWVVQVYPKKI